MLWLEVLTSLDHATCARVCRLTMRVPPQPRATQRGRRRAFLRRHRRDHHRHPWPARLVRFCTANARGPGRRRGAMTPARWSSRLWRWLQRPQAAAIEEKVAMFATVATVATVVVALTVAMDATAVRRCALRH